MPRRQGRRILRAGAALLGTANNYISGGANKGDPGIGFSPKATVPGLGTVNVPTAIQAESSEVGPGPQMDKLVYDWARLVNKDVPIFSFGDRRYPLAYSTLRRLAPEVGPQAVDHRGNEPARRFGRHDGAGLPSAPLLKGLACNYR